MRVSLESRDTSMLTCVRAFQTRSVTRPEWRNGRRGGLKIRWPQGRVGSTPSSGTSTIHPAKKPGI